MPIWARSSTGSTAQRHDAAVVTFESLHPRWSFVQVGPDGFVCEAAEKRVISRNAIAGFYYYRTGKLFLDAALRTLEYEAGVDGAYFISQTLNNLVLEGRKIACEKIDAGSYHSFYSPQKVQEYERHVQNRHFSTGRPLDRRPTQINVVIPMAGLGSRFAKAGYTKPKPFIDVAGHTMIERVMANLAHRRRALHPARAQGASRFRTRDRQPAPGARQCGVPSDRDDDRRHGLHGAACARADRQRRRRS